MYVYACLPTTAADGNKLRSCKIEGNTQDAQRSRLVKQFEKGAYQVF
jgi:hypothetical protein